MSGEKIRILHVAQAAGGVDRYLRSLLKYLDHDRFENILVCSQDYRPEDYKETADTVLPLSMHRDVGIRDIKAVAAVRRLIRKNRPDIVYAHSSKAGAIARLAAIGLPCRCIYNPHGWAFNMQGKKQFIYKLLEMLMAPFADAIVCISEAEKKSALRNKICSEKKLRVISNGIDIQGLDSSQKAIKRSALGISDSALLVGMVGRLAQQKAPDVFVRMAKSVRERIPEAHFLIVGEGPMRADIERYAEQNGLNHCLHITGWVDDPLSYIRLMDIAVLLSRWEGFGLVLPEYMLCEKPIVAAGVDAIPYIVDDRKNGLLVPPEDPDAACAAVIELAEDEALRTRLVAQGRADVYEKYDVRRVSQEHAALFESLMK